MSLTLVLLTNDKRFLNRNSDDKKFSENAKTALIRPLYNKNDRGKIQNYRPVSISNGFLKIYERYLLNSLSSFIDKILSNFIVAYRKFYSSNDVLLRLIENWKKQLEKRNLP